MPAAADLTLPELSISDPDFGVNPQAKFTAARRQHPWLAKSPVGYVVTEYFAARDLMSLDTQLRTAEDGVIAFMKAENTEWARWQKRQINMASGAHHDRLRNAVAPMFTPAAANRHRGLMRRVISELLEEWVPKQRINFEDFASFFPITVMCSIVGASSAEIPRLKPSLEAMGLSFNLIPDFMPELEKAYIELEEFSKDVVAARLAGKRLTPEPDLLDSLLTAVDSGALQLSEIYDLFVIMFVAGYDTSKNVLTMLMHKLIDMPEIYTRCAEDLNYCGKVIEEILRYSNPATIPRLTNEDIVFRDVTFPKDSMIFFPVSVLGRDPSAVANPDAFDPDREHVNRYLAFGRGMHMCLGQFIARAQMQEGLHLIAQRMTKPKLVGEIGWRPFPGVWGIRGLPIEFTPAPLRPELKAAS
jgi:cytochrome P450